MARIYLYFKARQKRSSQVCPHLCFSSNNHRWVMIYFPNNSDKIFTRRNSKILVVLCWLMPPLFLLPSLTRMWGRHGLECRSRSCTILSDSMGRSPKDFILVIGVTVPSIILLITNISIYTKVKVIR